MTTPTPEKKNERQQLTKHLNDTTLLISLDQVLHGELALADLELAPLASQAQDTVTSDTGQDRSVQLGGHQLGLALLVLPVHKAVHGANLGHLVIGAKQPQVLLEAFLVGIQLGLDAGGIVASDLGITSAAGPGTDLIRGGQQVDSSKARREVRTHGGGNDEDHGLVRGANAEGLLGADHGRAQVQGVTTALGDPAVIDLEELANALDKLIILEALND